MNDELYKHNKKKTKYSRIFGLSIHSSVEISFILFKNRLISLFLLRITKFGFRLFNEIHFSNYIASFVYLNMSRNKAV